MVPCIQPNRRIPLHYVDVAYKELQKLIDKDIYEGPLEVEEPGLSIKEDHRSTCPETNSRANY